MGSWNTTCGLTNLPIYPDNEVKLFLIEENIPLEGDECYATHLWFPRCLPFDATYADYGQYSLIDNDWNTENYSVVLSTLKHDLVELKKGESGIGVTRRNLNWDVINDAIHESRLLSKANIDFIQSQMNDPDLDISTINYMSRIGAYIKFFPVHKSVYDRMVNFKFGDDYRYVSLEDSILDKNIILDKIFKKEEQPSSSIELLHNRWIDINKIDKWFNLNSCPTTCFSAYVDVLSGVRPSKILVEEIAKFQKFIRCMDFLRKSFIPNHGGQESTYDGWQELHKAGLEVILESGYDFEE